MKKCLTSLLALAMVFSMTACGGAKGEPKTAAELMERSMTVEDRNNYTLSGTVNMHVAVSASGVSMEMPVDMTVNFDAATENDGHGTIQVSASMAGQSLMDSTIEMYVTKDTTYMSTDGGAWFKETTESADMNVTDLQRKLTATKYFKDADMTYDEAAKTYTVTLKMAALLEDDEFKTMFEDMDMGSMLGVDGKQMVEDMLAAFGEGDVVFTFDDTYHITSLVLKNMKYEGEMAVDAQTSGQMSISFACDLKLEGYGQVKADSVKAPADVTDGAVESTGTTSMFGLG